MLLYGRYRVHQELGEGGMANVFLAEDAQLGRMVAIKVIRPELGTSTELLQRFQNEARTCAGIHHTNVISVYDFGISGTERYLVMEYMDGPNLSRLVKGLGRPLTDVEAAAVVIQAADGLSQAHQQGIVHRDIKPENLLLSSEGVLKVADFGIVHRDGENGLTQTGAVIGSPNFMSPEQVDAEPVTEKTDIFALGAVLYFCFSGRSPFQGGSLTATLRNIGVATPRPLTEIRPELDTFWSQCIDVMLQKRPENRTLTLAALADGMREFLRTNSHPEPKQILKAAIAHSGYTQNQTFSEASQAELQRKLETRFTKTKSKEKDPEKLISDDEDDDDDESESFWNDSGKPSHSAKSHSIPVKPNWLTYFWSIATPLIMLIYFFFMNTHNLGYKFLKGITRYFHHQNVLDSGAEPARHLTAAELASEAAYKAHIDSLVYGIRHGFQVQKEAVSSALGKQMSVHPEWSRELALTLREAANKSIEAKALLPESEYYLLNAYFLEKNYEKSEEVVLSYLNDFPQSPFYKTVEDFRNSLKQMKDAGLY